MTGAVYTDFTQLATLRTEAQHNPNAALEDVASQFESLFVQMMLKSMRDATIKGDLFDTTQMDTYQQMADQQVALQLSESGGIGLARVMVEQMQTRGYVPPTAGIDNNPISAPGTYHINSASGTYRINSAPGAYDMPARPIGVSSEPKVSPGNAADSSAVDRRA